MNLTDVILSRIMRALAADDERGETWRAALAVAALVLAAGLALGGCGDPVAIIILEPEPETGTIETIPEPAPVAV